MKLYIVARQVEIDLGTSVISHLEWPVEVNMMLLGRLALRNNMVSLNLGAL